MRTGYSIVFLRNDEEVSRTPWQGPFSLAKDYAREILEVHKREDGATRAEVRDDIDRVVFWWPKDA